MHVVCPYTQLRHETEAALAASVFSPTYVDVTGSDHAYADLLRDLWSQEETFCLIEHDVVVNPDTLDSLADCECGYCAVPYPLIFYVAPALGCTKFSTAFIRRFPDAMERVMRIPTQIETDPGVVAVGAPGHWKQLDLILIRTILVGRYGQQPHVHLPPVQNLSRGVKSFDDARQFRTAEDLTATGEMLRQPPIILSVPLSPTPLDTSG